MEHLHMHKTLQDDLKGRWLWCKWNCTDNAALYSDDSLNKVTFVGWSKLYRTGTERFFKERFYSFCSYTDFMQLAKETEF